MRVEVTTHYLEMHEPGELRPKVAARPDVALGRVPAPMPELNRFFYTAVGGDWYWIDRLRWTRDDWLRWLDRSSLETWVLSVGNVPAGYFELEMQESAAVEIAYFGLLPPFIGQGLGGHLLTCAIERGWQMGASRVWLHTCSLDHPNALAHYQARGLKLFHVETETKDLSEQSCGPWPGAK